MIKCDYQTLVTLVMEVRHFAVTNGTNLKQLAALTISCACI